MIALQSQMKAEAGVVRAFFPEEAGADRESRDVLSEDRDMSVTNFGKRSISWSGSR